MSDAESLLVGIESNFPKYFREYYSIKRQNFFAGVTQFPDLWDCLMRLDGIFAREFDDLRVTTEIANTLPLMVCAHAHAQYRIFLELGFTGAFPEAFNIARMAIESVYQARMMLANEGLQRIWTRKDRSEEDAKRFEKGFDHEKQKKYTALGLKDLHTYWKRFSLWSHPSVTALSQRFRSDMSVMYFETDPKTKALHLFDLLLVAYGLETAFFSGFESRLKLDYALEKQRKEFGKKADQTRLALIKKFDFTPPSAPPHFPYA